VRAAGVSINDHEPDSALSVMGTGSIRKRQVVEHVTAMRRFLVDWFGS